MLRMGKEEREAIAISDKVVKTFSTINVQCIDGHCNYQNIRLISKHRSKSIPSMRISRSDSEGRSGPADHELCIFNS